MGVIRRRSYSAEHRAHAVKMVVDSSRTVADVARELGISARTLHSWVAEYRSFVPAEVRAQFLAVLRDTDLPDRLPLGRTVNIYYEVCMLPRCRTAPPWQSLTLPSRSHR